MKLPPGTYVLLIGLSTEVNNGLLGIVQGISDNRISIKICDTNRILKVKPENVIFPDNARDPRSFEASTEIISIEAPELKTAHSLLTKVHQAHGNQASRSAAVNELLSSFRKEVSSVVKNMGESPPKGLQKQINFISAHACRFENDLAGVRKMLEKHFPMHTESADEAWNDYPELGMSVVLALQNLAAAIGMAGDEVGERKLLAHAVERFQSGPAPHPPLHTILMDIAVATEQQVGLEEAVPWYRQAADAAPDCFTIRFRLAKALYKTKKPDAADELIRAIQEAHPGDPSCPSRIAACGRQVGPVRRAIGRPPPARERE